MRRRSSRAYTDTQVLGLVGAIYEGAGVMPVWPSPVFLQTLGETTRCCYVIVRNTDYEARVDSLGLGMPASGFPPNTPELRELYDTRLGMENPWVFDRPAALRGPGTICVGEQLVDQTALRRTDFYGEFACAVGFEHALDACVLGIPPQVRSVTLLRPKEMGSFGAAEVELLQRLMPHLQRAADLHVRMLGLHSRQQALEDAIDRVPLAIGLVDAEGRLTVANRSLRAILGQGDGLEVDREGRFVAARAHETSALRKLIVEAARTGTGSSFAAGGTITLGRPSCRRPLEVLVAPMAGQRRLQVPQSAFAVVFVSDPDSRVETPAQVLRRLYGLTPTEARLAALLVEQPDLETARERMRLSRNTAKTHLKRVYAKTGVRGRADLVRLLLSGVAPVAGTGP